MQARLFVVIWALLVPAVPSPPDLADNSAPYATAVHRSSLGQEGVIGRHDQPHGAQQGLQALCRHPACATGILALAQACRPASGCFMMDEIG